LSLLALVDQFGAAESPAPSASCRIEGGNERLANALAAGLGHRIKYGAELVAVSHRGRDVRASVRDRGRLTQLRTDYLLFALPAVLLRRISIAPALPGPQHDVIGRLRYGRATKTLLQFSNRFWRSPGRPRAFGSALPFGAAWEGNEDQRGRRGILSLLAGGSASNATGELLRTEGTAGLVRSLDWLGSKHAELLAWHQTVWEDDPWSCGGYAFFDPGFDPEARSWLARPCGRLFFAGEHTSMEGQGYMNGAVESGRRAAAEVAAVHQLRG
jgi:monoamine oxidase